MILTPSPSTHCQRCGKAIAMSADGKLRDTDPRVTSPEKAAICYGDVGHIAKVLAPVLSGAARERLEKAGITL